MKVILLIACVQFCGHAMLLADDSIPGDTIDPSGTAYGSDEILDRVEEMFGGEVRSGIEMSGVGIVEIEYPATTEGDHDNDTIGLNTKDVDGNTTQSLSDTALVTVHEFNHGKRARANGDRFDPTTTGRLGNCNHAAAHYNEVLEALYHSCEDLLTSPNRAETCNALGQGLASGDQRAAMCKKAGGEPPSSQEVDDLFAQCCAL